MVNDIQVLRMNPLFYSCIVVLNELPYCLFVFYYLKTSCFNELPAAKAVEGQIAEAKVYSNINNSDPNEYSMTDLEMGSQE